MALFLNLYIGHLLGDFMLQPGRLVLAKRDGAPGLVLHTGIVGLASALVVFATIGADWPSVVLVTGLHLLIERFTILAYLKTRTRGLFTLLLDQTMHLLSIGLVVELAGRWHLDTVATTFGMRLPIATVAFGAGLLVVALFGSILAFESANSLEPADEGKGEVLRLDLPRVGGMIERTAALALAMLWTPAAVLIPFAPRVIHTLTADRRARSRSLAEASAGLLLCVLVYAALRLVGILSGTVAGLAGVSPVLAAGIPTLVPRARALFLRGA